MSKHFYIPRRKKCPRLHHAGTGDRAAHDDHGQLADLPAGARSGEVQPVHELHHLLPDACWQLNEEEDEPVWNAKYCKAARSASTSAPPARSAGTSS